MKVYVIFKEDFECDDLVCIKQTESAANKFIDENSNIDGLPKDCGYYYEEMEVEE